MNIGTRLHIAPGVAAACALLTSGCLGTFPSESPDAGSLKDGSVASDGTDARSDGPGSTLVDATADSARDATGDSAVDARSTSDARLDAAVTDGADSAVDAGTNPDAEVAVDAADAAPSCTDECTQGLTRCLGGDGGSGAEVQSCEVQSSGCTAWVTSATCGDHQTCSTGDAGASCTCMASPCTASGTVCEPGNNETVDTCSTDAQGCLYVASTMACAAPESCGGTAPNAACSLTCSDSCSQGQTTCGSNGGLATCTLGSNGCWAYGAPSPCPSTRQACTGTAGSQACTCQPDPNCSSASPACDSGKIANCAVDPQGCYYEASTTACTGGQACSGGACACPSGQVSCNGSCTNKQTDPNNCGACGNVCNTQNAAVTCSSGTCTISCNAGTADCDNSAANGCESTLATDPNHCGSCDNACPGASHGQTCSNGRCQPYSIASASTPFALATDGVNVYYLATPSPGTSTTIAAVPIGGGTVSGPFSAAGALSIATDSVDVYWGGYVGADPGGAGYLDLAPVGNVGTASSVLSYTVADSITQLFADVGDGRLFVGLDCDGISSVPLKTTGGQLGTPGASGTGCPGSIAADANSAVYWSGPAMGPYSSSANSLTGVFKYSGGFITLSSAANPQGIAIQGSTIYYTDAAGGTVSAVPTDGSKAPTALAIASSPLGLVADSSNVYWIDGGGSTIMRVPLTGGQATTLATGQSATAIAQDGSSIYWTNSNAIMRMPK